MPARVLDIKVGASAPGKGSDAFNATEIPSPSEPSSDVHAAAAITAGPGFDRTPPAGVSGGFKGLSKTLSLAGKVSLEREHREKWSRPSSLTAEPDSPTVCGTSGDDDLTMTGATCAEGRPSTTHERTPW